MHAWGRQHDDHRPQLLLTYPRSWLSTCSAEPDLVRSMRSAPVQAPMSPRPMRSAEPGEWSPERTSARNGYRTGFRSPDRHDGRSCHWKLRGGVLLPGWLCERHPRAERWLTTVMAACYLSPATWYSTSWPAPGWLGQHREDHRRGGGAGTPQDSMPRVRSPDQAVAPSSTTTHAPTPPACPRLIRAHAVAP